MTWARLIPPVLALGLVLAPPAAGQQSTPGAGGFIETPRIMVSLSRDQVATRLGESFGFESRIENTGTGTWTGLVAHLNVVGLSSGIYVDPEDWSEERTKNVPSLGPGDSTQISWDVKAVTGGHAAIYVVVLPDDPAAEPGTLTVSPALDVQIAETKNLNSDGVLPLALGVPALLGLVTLGVRRRRRR